MEDTKASLMLSRQVNLMKGTNGQDDAELPPPPPASQIYKELQTKLRQNLPRVTVANEVLNAESKGVTHYGIKMERILEVLEENFIQLESYEVDYIKKRFSNHRGEISFNHVINSLNVGRPIEHVEPELMIDTLPQPFKMIVEIFEEEIFDIAWFEIIRKHPDIEVDSNGKQLFMPRNRNLEMHAAPDVQHSSKPSGIVSMIGAPVGGYSFAVTSNGAVLTLQSNTGKLLNSIAAFGDHDLDQIDRVEDEKIGVEGDVKQEGEGSTKSSDSCIYWITSVSGPHTIDGLFRIVVVRSEDRLQPPFVQQDDAATAKGKKGAVPELAQEFKPHVEAKISIVEVKISDQASDTRASSYLAFCTSTLESDGMQKITTDLSPDGQVLTVNHGNSISIYTLAKSKAAVDRKNDKKVNKLTGIMEDIEFDAFGDPAFPEVMHLNDPEIRFSPPMFLQSVLVKGLDSAHDENIDEESSQGKGYKSSKLLKDVNILKAFFFPLKFMDGRIRRTKNNNTAENAVTDMKLSDDNGNNDGVNMVTKPAYYDPSSIGIAVIYEGIEEFSLFSFTPLKVTENKIEEVPDPKANKGKGKGKDKGLEEVVAPTPSNRLVAILRLSQRLACDASSIYVDTGRCSLFLGLRDGSVTCFDILTKTMPALLGRHASAITALNLVTWNVPSYGYQKSRSCLVLVSGAMDGSISFYHIDIPHMCSSNDNSIPETAGVSACKTISKAKRRGVEKDGPFSKCLTGKFLSFRRDTIYPVLSFLTIPGHPVFLAYTLDGTLAVYTADTLNISSSSDGQQKRPEEPEDELQKEELLGKLVMATGMEAHQNPSSIASSACLQPSLGISLQEGLDKLSADSSSKWRVARFMPSPLEAVQNLRHMMPTTAMSSNGILNVFLLSTPDVCDRPHTPILTAHSLSSLLKTLCVGLNACCTQKPDLPASALFTTMTYEERIDADMTVSKIKFFRQQLEPSTTLQGPTSIDLGGSMVSSNSNSRLSTATKSVVGTPSGLVSNHRRKSSTSKAKHVLNEENLRELQAQIDPIAEYFSNMKVAIPTVSEACSSRIIESDKVALSAIEESKKTRAGRGVKMLKSLRSLPDLL